MAQTGKVFQVSTNGTSLSVGKIAPASITGGTSGQLLMTNASLVPTFQTHGASHAITIISLTPNQDVNVGVGPTALSFDTLGFGNESAGFGPVNMGTAGAFTRINATQYRYNGITGVTFRIAPQNVTYLNDNATAGSFIQWRVAVNGIETGTIGLSQPTVSNGLCNHLGEGYVTLLNNDIVTINARRPVGGGTGTMKVQSGSAVSFLLISTTY